MERQCNGCSAGVICDQACDGTASGERIQNALKRKVAHQLRHGRVSKAACAPSTCARSL
jgi:hypothetical protein